MTAEQQLKRFIAKFAPPHQKLIRAVRKALRARLPSANELVYDNYNFLVLAWCPTEKTTDSFFSLAAGASGVNIAFGYNGTKLRDPEGLLVGSGKLNRMLRVPEAKTLDRPAVKALLAQSLEVGKVPLPPRGKGRLIIRSVSAKQRPRR